VIALEASPLPGPSVTSGPTIKGKADPRHGHGRRRFL